MNCGKKEKSFLKIGVIKSMINEIQFENMPFEVKSFKTRKEWLNARKGTIGGSDAACVIDKNPYKSKQDYIDSLKSEVIVKDNQAMAYGRDAEDLIRQLFDLENNKKLNMFYMPNTTFISKVNSKMSFSPDGVLLERKTNRYGIWECKTTFAKNKNDLDLWDNQIPNQYYVQILHGLLVTGFDFAILTAKIKVYNKENKTYHSIIKDYRIERSDVIEDIEFLKSSEIKFIDENLS